MNDTMEALVRRIQGGAQEDMEELWSLLQGEVRRQAVHWGKLLKKQRPGVTPADLYQCGYLALDRAVKEYASGMGISFERWFLILLRLEFARAAGHRAIRVLEAAGPEHPRLCRPQLEEALHTLPAPLFRTLYLRYLLGLSERETGILLEVSPETVSAWEAEGLRAMGERLTKDFNA